MDESNSNPLEGKPANGTTSSSRVAPMSTIKVTRKTVPVPRGVPTGQPASAGPNGLVASPTSPRIKETPSAIEAKAKVPQAATPVAARPDPSQNGVRPPRGAPTGTTANVMDRVGTSPIPPRPEVEPVPPSRTPVRQYYLSDDLGVKALGPGVQQAFVELVDSCMAEMVVAEDNPTAKAIAGPIPFEKSCEILLQCRLAALYMSEDPDWQEIERLTSLLDRIARRVHRATDQLIRLQVLKLQRSKHEQGR